MELADDGLWQPGGAARLPPKRIGGSRRCRCELRPICPPWTCVKQATWPDEHRAIPIDLAAVNPYNVRLVGEVADGLRTHGFTTRLYQERVIIPAILEGLRRAGRPRSAVTLSGGGFIATGADWATVEKQI